ncbi:protein-glutamate O-methyltransferase CheR [Bacteriovoracales bacterium]|nr:protein-glutamate O-methyltransferase CheR [Bacteriovoracales bacterium]
MSKEIQLEDILKFIKEKRGLDFSTYNDGAIKNRFEQFKIDKKIKNNNDLLQILKDIPDNIEELLHYFYIASTAFFRDTSSFDFAQKELRELLKEHPHGQEFRVWVAGCATGEEAYSLAIIVREECEKLQMAQKRVKIFATDINLENLALAESGLFHSRFVETISSERKRRFFEKQENQYQISPLIKDMVVFSPHNVVEHAPFFNLDFISCRNLLIYLKPEENKRVIAGFHEGLKEGGLLFLGQSDRFEFPNLNQLNSNHQLHQKGKEQKQEKQEKYVKEKLFSRSLSKRVNEYETTDSRFLTKQYSELLLKGMLPDGIFLNHLGHLLYTFGRAKEFIKVPVGAFSQNAFGLISEELKLPLETVFKESSGKETSSQFEVKEHGLVLVGHFLKSENFWGLFVHFDFVKKSRKKPISKVEKSEIELLKRSLRESEGKLSIVEEERKDLRNSMQILLSSREHSLGEKNLLEQEGSYLKTKTMTLNNEVKTLKNEVKRLKDQVKHWKVFFDRAPDSLIILDGEGTLKTFNETALEFYPLRVSDIGKPLSRLNPKGPSFDLDGHLQELKKTREVLEKKLVDEKGQTFSFQLVPLSEVLYLFKIVKMI